MSDLVAGDLVDNRYIVERLLGRGGMAAVYLARHRTLGSFHALKVLELDRPSVRKRLIREGAVQSRFRHPNLVSVTDAIEVDGKAALVMEYVHGPNLAAVIEQGRMSLDEIDAVAAGVFDGLEAAHRQGIVHRDFKPHNVLMSIDEHGVVPKVADFGLVKVLDEDGESAQTRTGMVFGTPEYMAPEQIRNAKGVDERADIFSLGVMLYEMVSGERPFGSGDLLATLARVTNDERKPLREVAPDAPERMVAAVERALVADRENRVKSVAELRALWFQQTPRTDARWDRAKLLSLVDPLPTVPSEPGGPATLAKSSVTATRSDTTRPAAPTAVPASTPAPAKTAGSETVDFGSLDAAVPPAGAPITRMAEPPRAAAPITVMAEPPAATGAPKAPPAPSISDFELQQRSNPTKWLVPAAVGLVLVVLLVLVGAAGALGLVTVGQRTPPPAPPAPPVEAPVAVEPQPAAPEAPPTIPSDAPPTPPAPGTAEPAAPVKVTPREAPATPTSGTPDVVVEPPPAEVATVTTPDPPPPAPTGPPPRVRVEGADQMTVVLRDVASGKHLPPSDAIVGTYEIVAFFEPNVPTIVKTVELGYGAVVTVRCSLAGKRCVVSQ